MTASSVPSRRKNAYANQVGAHSKLRQRRYFTASGRLTISGIAPPTIYRTKSVDTFWR